MPQPLDRLRELSAMLDPALLSQLVEVLPDAILVINREGQIVLVNTQCELLFGYHRDDLLGKVVEVLLPESMREPHRGFRDRFFADPRVRPMGSGQVLPGLHRDGSALALDINLSPLISREGVYAVAVLRRRAVHGA